MDEYYFPAAFVTCAPLDDPAGASQSDATPVVEVLSPRTAKFDRTASFDAYKRLPSLQECLLLDSRYMRADLDRKLDEQWVQTTVLAGGELVPTSIGLVLPSGMPYLRSDVSCAGRDAARQLTRAAPSRWPSCTAVRRSPVHADCLPSSTALYTYRVVDGLCGVAAHAGGGAGMEP